MSDILREIKPFKAELKEKWLNYYQTNRIWLNKLDGHGQSISNSWFILGVITALEPKSELKELLQYFLLVTQDCDKIITALGLNFDPELELEKQSPVTINSITETDLKYLDRVREEIKT